MDNSSASQHSPEMEILTESLQDGKKLEGIIKVIQQEVGLQIEGHLQEFYGSVSQMNLAAIETMYTELAKIKEQSATMQGVMERLKLAVAPDLPEVGDEVVSFRQAIDNLERYGSIIPSSSDIVTAQIQLQKNHAWSIVRQALAKLLIKKLEGVVRGNSTIS